MVELGMEEYIAIESFNSKSNPSAGAKPAFLFNGALFETNEDYKVFANIIVGTCKNEFCSQQAHKTAISLTHTHTDFFRGTVIDKVNLYGNNHVIVCSTVED